MTSPSPRLLPPPPPLTDAAALFLDLDGTLLDIAERPQDVVVAAGLREALARLHARLGGALALVSGRPLAEIDQLSRRLDFAAAGLHGAQLRTPDGRVELPAAAAAAALEPVRAELAAFVPAWPGVLVEDKRDALAVHYRQAPQAADAVRTLAGRWARIAGSGFTLQHGLCVVELRPAGNDKGTAVARLMREAPFAGRVPWMIGDDLTDEHAFHRVNALGGISVVVGARRPSAAHHALDDPPAVRRWLAEAAGLGGTDRDAAHMTWTAPDTRHDA
ncbi:MAG: trehalose-phosphatase [Dokdonella sp.]|nr:trehalose-phosphatase [Dokdonella sp.]